MEKQISPTNINIHQVFPMVKVLEFEISYDPKEVVQKLNPYISADLPTHELLVNSNAVMTSNDTPWRPTGTSSYKTLENILNQKEFLSLKEEISCCVKEYNKRYRIHKKDIKLENSWFNVMPKDSQLIFHIHNGSLLTGAYYPLLPEGSADLTFIDPEYVRSLITSGKSVKGLEEKGKSKDDNREKRTIPIKEGHAYVFPSWLEHGTLNNNCDKRIVISFNSTFSDAGEYGHMLQQEFVGKELEEYMKGLGRGKKNNIQQLFNHYRPTAAKAIPSFEDTSLVQSNSLYYES
jgi:uncharacterized protein (TIGR02466 family)